MVKFIVGGYMFNKEDNMYCKYCGKECEGDICAECKEKNTNFNKEIINTNQQYIQQTKSNKKRAFRKL